MFTFLQPDSSECVDNCLATGELEDPVEIKMAVEQLIKDVPPMHPVSQKCSSSSVTSDPQFFRKLHLLTQTLPPVSKQSSQIKVSPVVIRAKEEEKPAPKQAPTQRQSVIRLTRSRCSDSDRETSADVKRVKTSEGSAVPVDMDNSSTTQRVGVVIMSRVSGKRHHSMESLPESKPEPVSPVCYAPPINHPPCLPPNLAIDSSYDSTLEEPQFGPMVASLLSQSDEYYPFTDSIDSPAAATPMEVISPLSQIAVGK